MEKLCWNIWMNPKSNYKGPLKREAQREIWHLQNRRRQWNQEGEIRETQPQSRNAGSYRKTEEARISFSSRASGGSTARPTPWSGSVRLISHFRFPEAWENELRLFLATSCGDLLQQPQEINTLTNYKLFQSGCWNRHCPGPKRVSCESSPPFQMALSLLRGFIHVPVLHSTLWTLLGDPPQLSRLLCLSCSLSLCYSVLRTRTCLVSQTLGSVCSTWEAGQTASVPSLCAVFWKPSSIADGHFLCFLPLRDYFPSLPDVQDLENCGFRFLSAFFELL